MGNIHKIYKQDILNSLLIGVLVILMAFLLTPIESKWAYNTDEAIEMSRLFHLSKGFTFYREMWTDHPPGWTWLLYGWDFFFDQYLFSAKMLALFIAASGIIAFYWILILFFDRISSVFGILLFTSTARFLPAISSITIDMPSLSMGLVAMALFLYGIKNSYIWFMILSGLLFAYAMTIKFFTAVIIVTLLGCSIIISKHISSKINYKFLALWLGVIISGFCLLMLFYFPFPYYHLVEFHKNARPFFGSETLIKLFIRASKQDFIFLFISAISILLTLTKLKKDLWRVLIPLVFLVLIIIQFSIQRPIWWIYYPLIAFPLSWICCLPFSNFVYSLWHKESLKDKPLNLYLRYFAIFIFLLPIGQGYWNYYVNEAISVAQFRSNPPSIAKQQLLDSIQQFNRDNKWIITDDAMFAVYANIPIPPEIAVLSTKRIITEKPNDQFILDLVNRYQPEQIVWIRFSDFFEKYNLKLSLENMGYESIETPQPKMYHFVKKSLLKSFN